MSQIDTELTLSEMAVAAGDAKDSETYAREALVLAKTLRGDKLFSSWVGLAQLSSSAVAEREGDIPTARQLLLAALAQLTATLGESHSATKEVRASLASLH